MRPLYLIPLVLTLVCSSAIPHALQAVEKTDTCASKDIKAVVDILKILKAAPFCSSFLKVTTSTTTAFATTAGSPAVQTISTTNTVVVSRTSIVSSTETDVSTSTTTTGNPATVISTIPSTTVTTTTTTSPTTATVSVTTYFNAGVAKRDAMPENMQRDFKIPPQLIQFGLGLITTACRCYVSTPTATVTSTVTTTPSSAVTTTALSTTTLYVATSTAPTTTTTQTTVAVPNTAIVTVSTTSPTTTTTTTTSTSVQVVTATATISASYTKVFSGTDCVYNEYTDFLVLEFAGYPGVSSFEEARQDCAIECDKRPACKFFFIDYSPPSGRFSEEYDCIIDNQPYQPAFVQCGVGFTSRSEGYKYA